MKRLFLFTIFSIFVFSDFSLLHCFTITHIQSKVSFKCVYQIFSGTGFFPDFFKDGIMLFENLSYFKTYEDLLLLTDVGSEFENLIFDISDELEFTHRGIEKK